MDNVLGASDRQEDRFGVAISEEEMGRSVGECSDSRRQCRDYTNDDASLGRGVDFCR